MLSHNVTKKRVIQPSPSISKNEIPILTLNFDEKPQDLEANMQHRDCSSLGKVFRDIRQWELNRLQKRKQKSGLGVLACVLLVGGILGLYFGAWLLCALFFICSAAAAGYLPMISSPQPPATLRFLPSRVSPRTYSLPVGQQLQSQNQSTVVKVKSNEADSSEAKQGLEAGPSCNSQPVDNIPAPVLRFSAPKESKIDTFDIVAQGKICSVPQNDILVRAKI